MMKDQHPNPVGNGVPKILLVMLFSNLILPAAHALVRFEGETTNISFIDAPAEFTLPFSRSEFCGTLHLADPIDACSSLLNRVARFDGEANQAPFVLIKRGECAFELKVRNAQDAGFKGAIIYDDREHPNLVSMIGNPQEIWVRAVFISNKAGEILRNLTGVGKGKCCISSLPDGGDNTVTVILILSIFITVAVFGAILCARIDMECRQQQIHNRLDCWTVKSLPTIRDITPFQDEDAISAPCVICLEDYRDGENLRVLPCHHEFHAACVNVWLTKWGTFCPVCRMEMNKGEI